MKLVLHNSDGEVIKEMQFGKTTNFDRITASPEKLAEVLAKKALRPCGYELPCNVDCTLNERCMEDNEPPPTDYEVWLIWLKMESKE